MIEELLERFTAPKIQPSETQSITVLPAEVFEPSLPNPTDAICSVCRSSHQWRPKNSERWHCAVCNPSPSPSLIGEQRGQPHGNPHAAAPEAEAAQGEPANTSRVVTDRYHYTVHERCLGCRGAMVVETTWSDGSAEFRCWTCKAERVQS